jgi:aspartyl aminopeptidase
VPQAIVEAAKNGSALTEDTRGWMVALFEHEEVGSDSAQGAHSPVMFEAMKRATNPALSSPLTLGLRLCPMP